MATSRFKPEYRDCEICGAVTECEAHHVFAGTARQISDKYGAIVYCCRACHDRIHARPAEFKWLQDRTQRKVMEREEWDLDEWMQHFFKNYLEE